MLERMAAISRRYRDRRARTRDWNLAARTSKKAVKDTTNQSTLRALVVAARQSLIVATLLIGLVDVDRVVDVLVIAGLGRRSRKSEGGHSGNEGQDLCVHDEWKRRSVSCCRY
jgi:hypothetical protein